MGGLRSPRREVGGPVSPCHLLPEAALSVSQEVAAPCRRVGDSLGPLGPSTSSSLCFCHLPLLELFSAEGPGWGPLSLPPPSPPFPPSFSPAALCPGAEQLPFQ